MSTQGNTRSRGRGGDIRESRGGRSSDKPSKNENQTPRDRGNYRGSEQSHLGTGRGHRGSDFRGRGGGAPGGSVIFAEGSPTQIPPRLTEASHNDLVASFKALQVTPSRPLKPGYGTVGTPVILRSNFFAVRLPKAPIYDYTIEINPAVNKNKKETKSRIFQLLERSPQCTPHLSYIAHDRAQRLVSAQKLPQPLNVQVLYFEEEETGPGPDAITYTVSIKFERQLDPTQFTRYLDGKAEARDYDTLPLVSALNLILQQHASRKGVRVGTNKYFFPSAEKFRLGFGVEVWRGFYVSVRPAYKQLMVNVNTCFSAFIEPGNLADALFAFKQNSKGAMPNLPEALVRSLKVRTQHLHHKKSVKAIGSKSARQTKFNCPELGGVVSVEEYFLKKYNKKLKHPFDLPVVDLGGPNRSVWVPAELCDITPGQPYTEKLSANETSQMIRYACNPPKTNAEAIVNQGFPTLGLAPLLAPINGFDVSIEAEMSVIPARELPPPRATYQAGQASIKNGSWNILDVKFHQGARVTSWWVMVVQDGRGMISGSEDTQYKALETGFANKCRKSGIVMPNGRPRFMKVALPPFNKHEHPKRTDAIDMIGNEIKSTWDAVGQKPSFILVLLEAWDNHIYPGIKRLGDVKFGIHTVHMQLHIATNRGKQDQYFSNVALKLNTKLGGINHLLDEQAMKWLTKKKTMMVGIDVTHPGPGIRDGTPSIAAVVASVDDKFVQFPASLRIQQGRKEMLDELRDMVVERLLLYEKKNKMLPERILVFRDGVSEGQYDEVLKEEYKQILEAFKKLETKERKKEYKPTLSIIICGKRHHARFYPTNSANADRNGNTRPGTVVDKGITSVFDFDFYLQAHAGLQGTVRPTHYIVVYDENGLTANEIQQGTHTASYLYARATKAVSLVPPAYYADLACERGRCYLNDLLSIPKSKGRKVSEEEKTRVLNAARDAWGDGLHPDLRESMFYL